MCGAWKSESGLDQCLVEQVQHGLARRRALTVVDGNQFLEGAVGFRSQIACGRSQPLGFVVGSGNIVGPSGGANQNRSACCRWVRVRFSRYGDGVLVQLRVSRRVRARAFGTSGQRFRIPFTSLQRRLKRRTCLVCAPADDCDALTRRSRLARTAPRISHYTQYFL